MQRMKMPSLCHWEHVIYVILRIIDRIFGWELWMTVNEESFLPPMASNLYITAGDWREFTLEQAIWEMVTPYNNFL